MTCPPTLDGTIIPAQGPGGKPPYAAHQGHTSGLASIPQCVAMSSRRDVLVGVRILPLGGHRFSASRPGVRPSGGAAESVGCLYSSAAPAGSRPCRRGICCQIGSGGAGGVRTPGGHPLLL